MLETIYLYIAYSKFHVVCYVTVWCRFLCSVKRCPQCSFGTGCFHHHHHHFPPWISSRLTCSGIDVLLVVCHLISRYRRLCVFAYEYFIFLGRVTSPSAKPPFLKDQFFRLSLATLLRPVWLGRPYQEHTVPAGIARKIIEACKSPHHDKVETFGGAFRVIYIWWSTVKHVSVVSQGTTERVVKVENGSREKALVCQKHRK